MQMDSFTASTNGNQINKTNYQKSRKNATFSQVVPHKSDVGEFQGGYFVMADTIKENQLPQTRNKNFHKTTERQRERSPKDSHSNNHYVRPEGENNVSPARLSPSRSPHKNRRHSPNSQPVHLDIPTTVPPSPHKPRKAYNERSESSSLESGSPPKEKGPSPPSSRWAGPAFSNAPPPSSLPLPDFPPFAPHSASPSSSPPLASSMPQPIPSVSHAPPVVYHDAYFYSQPPVYFHPSPMSPFPGYSYAPSLDQLSMDLRRILHINEHPQPVPAIRA